MASEKSFKPGQPGQTVTPGWVSSKTRSDGTERVVYGNEGQDRPHGHSERDASGRVTYSRTIGGKEVKK